jgi:microsomal dipeptidase-like Zn-dependent dipeptidase
MYYLSKYDKNIEGVNGLKTDKELIKLPEKLRENYNKKEVDDICYNNFRRLFGNTI